MKYVITSFVLMFTFFAQAQVSWMTMDEALEAQTKEPRKILLKAYTDWCVNCKWMDQNSFNKEKIAAFINKNYYPVAFNAEGDEVIHYKGQVYNNPLLNQNRRSPHQFASFIRIHEYPTLVFFDEKGRIINPVPGKMDSKKLEIYVTMLADETYKGITTGKLWNEYQTNFNYQLQD